MDSTPATIEKTEASPDPETSPTANAVPVPPTSPAMCTCPTCTSAVQNALSLANMPGGESMNSKKKAPYVPPHPDIDTFPTQLAFLDSLAPVPIESVVENNARCPICWKPYGEAADHGFDNSELPVLLKCKHIFGNKCLRATFALPRNSTISLRPLAFIPGSQGWALGQRLHAFYLERPPRKDADHAGTFSNMLYVKLETLVQLFGQHWALVILELRRRVACALALYKITFLENAVILDRKHIITSAPVSPYEITQADSDLEFPHGLPHLMQPLPESPAQPPFESEQMAILYEKTLKLEKEREKNIAKLLQAKRELQWRKERRLQGMIAEELARIYREYLQCGLPTGAPEQEPDSHRYRFVDAQISVHKKDLKQSSFEVDSINMSIGNAVQEEDDNSDTENDNLGFTIEPVVEDLFPVVARRMCPQCWRSGLDTSHVPLETTPTTLWWKNTRGAPDDCPICHKILYHKDYTRQKPPDLQCESPDPVDGNDNAEDGLTA